MSMELLAVAASGAADRLLHRRGSPRAPGSSISRTCSSAWCTSPPWMRSRPGSTPAATAAMPRRVTRPGSASGTGSSAGWTGAGLEQERVARWYRQLHIFLYPFYYIEYGIAQIGALQIWRNSLHRSWRAPSPTTGRLSPSALSARLPEMYRTAGTQAQLRRRRDWRAGRAGRGADRAYPLQLPGGAS